MKKIMMKVRLISPPLGRDYNDDAGIYIDSVIDRSGHVWHYFMDNPVFLSKKEKEYQKVLNNFLTGGYVEDSSSGILIKEPSVMLPHHTI